MFASFFFFFFFFNDTATTEIYTLSYTTLFRSRARPVRRQRGRLPRLPGGFGYGRADHRVRDPKSTRLNSNHDQISYAVFCLKKKKSRLIGAVTKSRTPVVTKCGAITAGA